MTITIPFPTDSVADTYAGIKGYLKQLELCIHHAQKAVENAEKDGIEITEDSFVCFKHPLLEDNNLEFDKMATMKGFTDNYHQELQRVELQISLN